MWPQLRSNGFNRALTNLLLGEQLASTRSVRMVGACKSSMLSITGGDRAYGRKHVVRICRLCNFGGMAEGRHAFCKCLVYNHLPVKYGITVDSRAVTCVRLCIKSPLHAIVLSVRSALRHSRASNSTNNIGQLSFHDLIYSPCPRRFLTPLHSR